jgi:hypothetical protein
MAHTPVDVLAVCSRSARRSSLLARSSFVIFLLYILCCWASLAEVPSAPPGELTPGGSPGEAMIEFRGNRLSVRAHQAPWPVVLQAIERRTGIRLHVGRPLAGTATQDFEALPLEQGLRRLFRDMNVVFFYAAGTHAGTPTAQLTRVWLWPREGGTGEESQLPSSTAERAPMGHDEERPSGDMIAEARARTESEPQDGEPTTEEGLDERLVALRALAQQGDIGPLVANGRK